MRALCKTVHEFRNFIAAPVNGAGRHAGIVPAMTWFVPVLWPLAWASRDREAVLVRETPGRHRHFG